MNLFRRSSTGGEADSEANSGLKGSFLGRVFLPRSRTTSNCNLDRSSSVTSGLTSNLNSTSQTNNSHTNHGHSRYEMFQNTVFCFVVHVSKTSFLCSVHLLSGLIWTINIGEPPASAVTSLAEVDPSLCPISRLPTSNSLHLVPFMEAIVTHVSHQSLLEKPKQQLLLTLPCLAPYKEAAMRLKTTSVCWERHLTFLLMGPFLIILDNINLGSHKTEFITFGHV